MMTMVVAVTPAAIAYRCCGRASGTFKGRFGYGERLRVGGAKANIPVMVRPLLLC